MKNIFDLVTEPKFKEILEAYYNATTDEEREAVLKYQTELQESMTPEELEKFNGNILSSLHNIINVVDVDIKELHAESIREKLGELSSAISFSYISNKYFNKSKSWLIQRLNGSIVNGKEVHFNRTELQQFQAALHDIGNKLSTLVLL